MGSTTAHQDNNMLHWLGCLVDSIRLFGVWKCYGLLLLSLMMMLIADDMGNGVGGEVDKRFNFIGIQVESQVWRAATGRLCGWTHMCGV